MKTEIDTKTEQKGVGKLGWFMSKAQTATSPPREGVPAGTGRGEKLWYAEVLDQVPLAEHYRNERVPQWKILGAFDLKNGRVES